MRCESSWRDDILQDMWRLARSRVSRHWTSRDQRTILFTMLADHKISRSSPLVSNVAKGRQHDFVTGYNVTLTRLLAGAPRKGQHQSVLKTGAPTHPGNMVPGGMELDSHCCSLRYREGSAYITTPPARLQVDSRRSKNPGWSMVSKYTETETLGLISM